MNENLSSEFWDKRYQNNETGWDIGSASTPLKEYFDQLPDKTISILIPGCGNAYEAAYLLSNNFTNVTLIDLSPVVTQQVAQQLQQYPGNHWQIITGDFFDLQNQYDLIIEQTFFCALSPVLRPAYAAKMEALLKLCGKLAGVLFNRAFEGGPPFGGNVAEYNSLFQPHFQQLRIEPCYNSIPPRMGSEVFIIAKK